MTRDKFVEKEIKRTERTWSHHLLLLALVVNIVVLWKSEPIVVSIFIIGVALGVMSGYKFAFDRIRKRQNKYRHMSTSERRKTCDCATHCPICE